jgi:hypothetical protein
LNRQFFKRVLSTILPTCAIALGVLLAFIVSTGSLNTTMAHGSAAQTSQGQRVFSVSSRVRPTLILRGHAGLIHVGTGAPGKIIIKYVIRHTGAGRPATAAFGLNSKLNDVIAREIDYPRTGTGNDEINWYITVPKNVNLDCTTSAGPIVASNVNGRISLITNSGDVIANNVLMKEDSNLLTQAGSITLSGNVLVGHTCNIHTNAGAINVSFPPSARLYVSASLMAGFISSDFSGISTSRTGAVGYIGHGPYARVLISTQAGTIAIHRL